jgi:hypothetical protein
MADLPILAISDIEQAGQRVYPDILLVTPTRYRTINCDIPSAVDTVLANLDEIEALHSRLATLPEFDMDAVKKLRDRCKALLLAHAKCAAPIVDPSTLGELDKIVTKLRLILESEAKALIARDMLDPKALDGLRGANGYRNNAQDLLTVASQLETNYDTIQTAKAKKNTGWSVTKEELTTALDRAYELEEMAAKRDQSPETAAENDDYRIRAYTLFIESYDEARRGVEFFFGASGRSDEIAPSIYSYRTRPKASSSSEKA